MSQSTTTRKTLALICAILFVPSLAFALVASNLEKSLFDPSLYKNALMDAQVYQRLPPLIANQIEASAANEGGLPAMLVGALPQDTVLNMVNSALPANALQSLVENGVDQGLAYVNGKSGQAEISLSDLRQQVSANSGGLVDQYFNSLPECTLADALSLAGGLLGGAGELPKCNPPEAVRAVIAGPLQSALQEQLGQMIPGSFSLTETGGGLMSLFSALRWVRTAAQMTPILAIVLFVIMTLLAVRTIRDLLVWWGWPLLSAGLLGLLGGLIVGPAATTIIGAMVIARLPTSLGAGVSLLLRDVVSALASGLAKPILLDAALLTAIGGILLLVLRFGPRDEAENLQTVDQVQSVT